MAIIDPKGLFFGERLASCSDEAQLFWPRYYLAANTVARIELDYTKMLSGPLKSIHKKPSESQWIAVMREYHEKHLMFIYQVDGSLWGQFDTDPSNLPRYTTRDSNRSPAPPEENYAKWKDEYATEKAVRNSQGFLDLLTSTANHGESRRVVVPHGDVVHGVGVGVGVGVGKELSPEPKNGSGGSKPKSPARNGDEFKGLTQTVWDYYIKTIGRHPTLTLLTDKRKAMFKTRIRESWEGLPEPKTENAVEMCQFAIQQLAKSPHHNGLNDQRTKYLDWEIIFRTREQFEKWLNK